MNYNDMKRIARRAVAHTFGTVFAPFVQTGYLIRRNASIQDIAIGYINPVATVIFVNILIYTGLISEKGQEIEEQGETDNLALETRLALSGGHCYDLGANITAKNDIEFVIFDDDGKEIGLSPAEKIKCLTELQERLQSESFTENISAMVPSIFLRMDKMVTKERIEKSIKDTRDLILPSIEKQLNSLKSSLNEKKSIEEMSIPLEKPVNQLSLDKSKETQIDNVQASGAEAIANSNHADREKARQAQNNNLGGGAIGFQI